MPLSGISSGPWPKARLVAVLWFVTAALAAFPGWLLTAFAEDTSARVGAFVLLGCSAIAFGAGRHVVRHGTRALRTSLLASAAVAAGAISVLTTLSITGSIGANGILLFGGIPLAGATLTAVAAAVRMSDSA